jgi:uncharacterized Zn-finger protein
MASRLMIASSDESGSQSLDRYIRTAALCNSLALLTSQSPLGEFLVRYAVLAQLQKCWLDGHLDVQLVCSSSNNHLAVTKGIKSECLVVSQVHGNDAVAGDDILEVGDDWEISSNSTIDLQVDPVTDVCDGLPHEQSSSVNAVELRNVQDSAIISVTCATECDDISKLELHPKRINHVKQIRNKKATSAPVNDATKFLKRRRHKLTAKETDSTEQLNFTTDIGNDQSLDIVTFRAYTVCSICCHRFASSKSLTEHLRRVHHVESSAIDVLQSTTSQPSAGAPTDGTEKPSFVCSVCGRQFRLRQLLAAHTVTHTGERPSVCRFPGCGKRFGQTSTRNYHERTHSDARPYVCAQCGQCFKQPIIFKTHVSSVHGGARPYRCTQCGKTFKVCSGLHTHMKAVHSQERPHECEICQKRFTYRNQLNKHKRTLHGGERPWHCTVCDRAFAQPCNLRTHMRTHTGEKPYSCTVCGARFAHSGTLKGHVATHDTDGNQLQRQQPNAKTEQQLDSAASNLMDHLAGNLDAINGLTFWTPRFIS